MTAVVVIRQSERMRRLLGAGNELREKRCRPNQIRTSREHLGHSAVPRKSYLSWKWALLRVAAGCSDALSRRKPGFESR